MIGEPGSDLGMLMGGVVIGDGVDDLAGGDLALDGVQEADELLVNVLLHAAAEHRAIEHVEGGEQGGRAIALLADRFLEFAVGSEEAPIEGLASVRRSVGSRPGAPV
jgi:hypothetical protein